jgi:hypothetical protein
LSFFCFGRGPCLAGSLLFELDPAKPKKKQTILQQIWIATLLLFYNIK